MAAPADCRLIGRWRIVEADLWGRDYLDLGGPACLVIGTGNRGEITFGAMRGDLDLSYSANSVSFRWSGSDDMHEVGGEGYAELLDDGTVEITLAYGNGDEAILRACLMNKG